MMTCLLLLALPSDQRRPYRPNELPVLSPCKHDPREMLGHDRIARVATQVYAYFGRDSVAVSMPPAPENKQSPRSLGGSVVRW